MTKYQLSRFLGMVYVFLGLALFLFVLWEFLLKLIVALVALYVISLGLKMQGYPPSRFIFMAREWKSRF